MNERSDDEGKSSTKDDNDDVEARAAMGIVDASAAVVVHGDELRDMTDEELDAVLRYRQIVFARTR